MQKRTRQTTSPDARTDAARGTNQTGVRLYNERLVLSLIRRHGDLPKADMARLTGLSPQTMSIITNALEADGLVRRGEPQRGKVGQPLVPYSLNPEGALSFGLKIGRRSADLYLIDFVGTVLAYLHEPYPYPTPEGIRRFTSTGIAQLLGQLPDNQARRIAGLGIGAPFEMWTWHEEIGAPKSEIDAWRDINIPEMIGALCAWPVYFANDITAACAAELMFGRGADYHDFLYVYLGSFLGGGLVLNGHLFPGRHQNAAALGSMPALVPGATATRQLYNFASIYVLERRLKEMGYSAEFLWKSPDFWDEMPEAPLTAWLEQAAEALAQTIIASAALLDLDTIVMDGAFPVDVRQRLLALTQAAVSRSNRQGLTPFEVVEGSLGNAARAMGGAALPLLANFTADREVLFFGAAG